MDTSLAALLIKPLNQLKWFESYSPSNVILSPLL